VGDERLARESFLSLVDRSAELGGLSYPLNLLGREIGRDSAQQLLETRSASAAGEQSQKRRRIVHGIGP
jgi:hypothetical protein